MQRKILWVLTLLLIIITTIVGLRYIISNPTTDSNPDALLPETPVVQQPIIENNNNSTEDVQEQDRELVFDNLVQTVVTEEDFIDDTYIQEELEVGYTYKADYDFSNGFAVTKTENITPVTSALDYVEAVGYGSDAYIIVTELDALFNSVDSRIEEHLVNAGWSNYVSYRNKEFELSNVKIGEGLINYENYFEVKPHEDITINGNKQLLADTQIETSLGTADYIIWKDNTSYIMKAVILCDRERIIEVSIKDSKVDYLINYLIEITNDGIYLIK